MSKPDIARYRVDYRKGYRTNIYGSRVSSAGMASQRIVYTRMTTVHLVHSPWSMWSPYGLYDPFWGYWHPHPVGYVALTILADLRHRQLEMDLALLQLQVRNQVLEARARNEGYRIPDQNYLADGKDIRQEPGYVQAQKHFRLGAIDTVQKNDVFMVPESMTVNDGNSGCTAAYGATLIATQRSSGPNVELVYIPARADEDDQGSDPTECKVRDGKSPVVNIPLANLAMFNERYAKKALGDNENHQTDVIEAAAGGPEKALRVAEIRDGEKGNGIASIRLGTGGLLGLYYEFGDMISELAEKIKLSVEPIPTSGSYENLQGLEDGSFDAVFAQSDVIDYYNQSQASRGTAIAFVADSHLEYFHLICHGKNGEFDDPKWPQAEELDKETTIIVNKNSGSWISLQQLRSNSKYLRRARLEVSDESDDNIIKRLVTAARHNLCFFKVAGLNSKLIDLVGKNQNVDAKTKQPIPMDPLVLVNIREGQFDDIEIVKGEGLYKYAKWSETVDLKASQYGKLVPEDGTFYKFWTLAVTAKIVANKKWADSAGDQYSKLVETLKVAEDAIDERLQQSQDPMRSLPR